MKQYMISEDAAEELRRMASTLALGLPVNWKAIGQDICRHLAASLKDAPETGIPDYLQDDGK